LIEQSNAILPTLSEFTGGSMVQPEASPSLCVRAKKVGGTLNGLAAKKRLRQRKKKRRGGRGVFAKRQVLMVRNQTQGERLAQ
jgi:hypothetical protein